MAILILIAGVKSVSETLSPLLGQAPDPALVQKIRDMVLSSDGILGVHDLLVHNYGPDRYIASLHAEVPAEADILESHDRIDRIEREIEAQLGVRTVIHMDPVQTDSPRVTELHRLTAEVLRTIDPQLTFHDFRIVDGSSHTNLIFDVLVPHHYAMDASALTECIESELQKRDRRLYAVDTVDTCYTGEM